MKHNFSRILALLLVLATLSLAGCGGFFEEEVLQIATIESKLMDDGQTMITITYTDDTIEPYVFYIPMGASGEEGKDGNGILEIEYQHNDEKNVTEVRITYTDKSMKPVDFEIPYGVSVIGTSEPAVDPVTGETYITFLFSNGGATAPVFLPKGDTGNGIKNFTVDTETEDGSIKVKIELDKPVGEGDTAQNTFEFIIPAGKEGTGIEKVNADVEGELYLIDIWYTGDDLDQPAPTRLYFPRPKDPNQWYKGKSRPEDGFGNVGDFFYDDTNKIIYQKESINGRDTWTVIVSFKATNTEYDVIFNVNVSDGSVVWPEESLLSYKIKAGTYFWDEANGNKDIPIPYRVGYTFGGWYLEALTENEKPDATKSAFTDLTPVFSNLTLYAYWIPNGN